MVRQRKSRAKPAAASSPEIQLQHPDRDGPRIDGKTLFELAEERQLMQQADAKLAANKTKASEKPTIRPTTETEEEVDGQGPILSPQAERVLEAALWTISLAMLHFTFDTLVQHQYGVEIAWDEISMRAVQAWALFILFFYPLHPHESQPNFLPLLPLRYQHAARQVIFFIMSVSAGCYLIYVTNTQGYLATQKRSPPLGCLWLWAVMELDLPWASTSCLLAGAYLYMSGYGYK